MKCRMHTLIVLLILFSAGSVWCEEHLLVDFSRTTRQDWRIVSDEVVSRTEGSIGIVESERLGETLAVEFVFPATAGPAFYMLLPNEEYVWEGTGKVRAVELQLRGYNYTMKAALLARDVRGRQYELNLGTIDYSGWKTIRFTFPLSSAEGGMEGFIFQGLVFYMIEPDLSAPPLRRVELGHLTLEGW